MNWGTFLRREWGAATFVATVIVGLVAVPLALYFGNQSPAPVSVPTPTPSASVASAPATASPARTASPSPSASKSP